MDNRYLQSAIMSGTALITIGGAMVMLETTKHSTQVAAVVMSVIFGVFGIFSITMLIRSRINKEVKNAK